MHVNDLIMDIRADYKDCDDRLEKNYRREFENYSSTKLDDIWDAIQENHSYAKAPELGNIFKYMGLMGITRTKDLGLFYKRCTELKKSLDERGLVQKDADGDIIYIECNTKYSTRSKFCPTCNKDRTIEHPLYNSYEVVKCNKLPDGLRVLNELCATCNAYQQCSTTRGSKCSAWGSHDEYKKAGKKCSDCPCFNCCNEKPMNGIQQATFKLNKYNKV